MLVVLHRHIVNNSFCRLHIFRFELYSFSCLLPVKEAIDRVLGCLAYFCQRTKLKVLLSISLTKFTFPSSWLPPKAIRDPCLGSSYPIQLFLKHHWSWARSTIGYPDIIVLWHHNNSAVSSCIVGHQHAHVIRRVHIFRAAVSHLIRPLILYFFPLPTGMTQVNNQIHRLCPDNKVRIFSKTVIKYFAMLTVS